jgi:hypothetical protein
MTTLLVGLGACILGVVLGVLWAAYLDTNMHLRDQQAADAARASAEQYYVNADAQAAAMCRWMGQSYRSAGGVANNSFPTYAAPAPKAVDREEWVVTR